ncbi:MAG: hypothetical protein C4560_03635 [Nitrospiraceae bacterium]|nr:MAG: hypothetical protein C4560_03635 [Nitrospiraceae bacterium]
MKRLFIFIFILGLAGVFFFYRETSAFFSFPPLPPPEQYGNILINRTSEKNNMKPVTFSHWSHRVHYTCRVCHLELEFNMQLNTTEITEEANKSGKFCGACHDDRTAFGHGKENCDKCHNGDISYGREKFVKLKELPAARFGNRIDWVAAVRTGLIKPKHFISAQPAEMSFDKSLELAAENYLIPPAVFPHSSHTQWLDCSNCHPDIFNIKKKGTIRFSMGLCLRGEFCGLCHLKTAFPLNDCIRCHPDMSEDVR